MKVIILLIASLLCGCVAYAEGVPEVVLQTIAMESANQPIIGQAMVARTIQERAKSRHLSPKSVVLQPKQYSCWNSPKQARVWLISNYTPIVRLRALKAWEMASGIAVKPTHYHTKSVRPYWINSKHMKFVTEIGSHRFYREV